MTSVRYKEIEKFSSFANEWWNTKGSFKTLHSINKCRIEHIINLLKEHEMQLQAISAIDIGCGGGIATENLYQAGLKNITGIDASDESIKIAREHSRQSNCEIEYFVSTAEQLVEKGATYDIVIALEIIEHVNDIDDFLVNCSKLLNENGLLIISTINRTLKSLLLAKLTAEYILNLLPKETHSWSKFVKPSEIIIPLEKEGFNMINLKGIDYSPFRQKCELSEKIDMNYIVTLKKCSTGLIDKKQK